MQRKVSEIKPHHLDHFTSNPELNEAWIQNFSTKLSFAICWHPVLLVFTIKGVGLYKKKNVDIYTHVSRIQWVIEFYILFYNLQASWGPENFFPYYSTLVIFIAPLY